MNEKSPKSILPDLYIQINFDVNSPLKKSKSSLNSPSTMPESPVICFQSSQKNCKNCKNLKNSKIHYKNTSDYGFSERMKGLEEIGLFSEFTFMKSIKNNNDNEEKFKKNRAIHITDFMANNKKKNLIKAAGALDVYAYRKQEYQKEVLLREINEKKFFTYKEKSPNFSKFKEIRNTVKNSPQISKKKSGGSLKALCLDKIIERCDEALMISPIKKEFHFQHLSESQRLKKTPQQ